MRQCGAVPATVAVLNGQLRVGKLLHQYVISSYFIPFNYSYIDCHRWLGSRVAKALDLQPAGCEFNSQPRRCRVTTLGKLFRPTPMCLCHQAV